MPQFLEGNRILRKPCFQEEEIWASGDRGIIRWQLRWGESETDRIRGVNIMRVRDGKIVSGMGYVKG